MLWLESLLNLVRCYLRTKLLLGCCLQRLDIEHCFQRLLLSRLNWIRIGLMGSELLYKIWYLNNRVLSRPPCYKMLIGRISDSCFLLLLWCFNDFVLIYLILLFCSRLIARWLFESSNQIWSLSSCSCCSSSRKTAFLITLVHWTIRRLMRCCFLLFVLVVRAFVTILLRVLIPKYAFVKLIFGRFLIFALVYLHVLI